MGAVDLGQFIWPDVSQGRQPQAPVLTPAFAGTVFGVGTAQGIGATLTTPGPKSLGLGPAGRGYSYTSGGPADTYTLPSAPGTSFTLICVADLAYLGSYASPVGNDLAGARVFQLRFAAATGAVQFIRFDTSGGAYTSAVTPNGITVTSPPAVMIGRSSGTTYDAWLNGQTSGPQTISNTPKGQNTNLFVGGDATGTGAPNQSMYFAGELYLWALIPFDIGVQVCANLRTPADVYGLLFPTPTLGLSVPSAGGSTTLSATPGTWSWLGNTVGLPTFLSATPGAWSFSNPNVSFSSALAAGLGTWTWAGASTSFSQELLAAPGTWSWANPNATFNTSTSINAAPGTWSWAGTVAGFPANLAAAPGAYSWAGITATTAYVVPATVGAWSWAGLSSSFSAPLAATPGAWSWAGLTTQLIQQVTIQALPGAWSWSNPSVTIYAGGSILPMVTARFSMTSHTTRLTSASNSTAFKTTGGR